jgi:hypothetical protein
LQVNVNVNVNTYDHDMWQVFGRGGVGCASLHHMRNDVFGGAAHGGCSFLLGHRKPKNGTISVVEKKP